MRRQGRWLVAEFFVVVLGVLAALGVDTLVSRARDRARADDYRARLVIDLRNDARHLIDRWAWHERLMEYGRISLDVLEHADSPMSEARQFQAVFMASNDHELAPNTATWEDLLGTGGLGLLDVEARTQLNEYYTALRQGPPGWALPGPFRDRVRGLVTTDQVAQLNHIECAFQGLFDNRPEGAPGPDPSLPQCNVSMDVATAQSLLAQFRALEGIRSDLNVRMAQAFVIARELRSHADRARELADYLDSL